MVAAEVHQTIKIPKNRIMVRIVGWDIRHGTRYVIKETDRWFTANTATPRRGRIYHAKVFLDAVGTSRGVRNKMCSSGFTSFYLDKAFGTNVLVTASGTVDVWRIILK